MLNVLVLEDEDYTRRFIKKLLIDNIPNIKVFDSSDGEEALKISQENLIDIALLDIELGESQILSGLDIAKTMININSKTRFIFITGYSKYALDSFVVHPYDYILKPIDIEKVIKTLTLLSTLIKEDKNKSSDSNTIILKNKNEIIFIELDDIIFIETRSGEIYIYTKNQTYTTHKTLTKFKKQLNENFIQTHKSFVINKNKIIKLKLIADRSYEIIFKDTNEKALLSRYKFEEVKSHLIPSI